MATLQHVKDNLQQYNDFLKDKSYPEVIDWAFTLSDNRIVTTSFGKYSAVLLSTFYKKDTSIRVVWCDTRYTGTETYAHSEKLRKRFGLNIHKYESLLSREETDKLYELAQVDEPGGIHHNNFAEAVKIKPFKRALETEAPDVWFTNIRVRQTELRSKKDILSLSKDGILKVSPFYYFTDKDLDQFIIDNDLPKNVTYFDPVKALSNRECGIHLQ